MKHGNLRILLVEDNPGDAELLQESLSGAGATLEVVHVTSLEQAAWRLEQGTPVDAILLDLGLPDSSGLATLERAGQAAPHLPILVLTGMDDEGLGIEALRKRCAGLPGEGPDHAAAAGAGDPSRHRAETAGEGAGEERGAVRRWPCKPRRRECGIGTCRPTPSSTPRDGSRCSAIRSGRSSRTSAPGSDSSIPTTRRGLWSWPPPAAAESGTTRSSFACGTRTAITWTSSRGVFPCAARWAASSCGSWGPRSI